MICKTKQSLCFFLIALINLFMLMFIVSATAQVWPPTIPEGYIDAVVGNGTSPLGNVCGGGIGPMEGDGGSALLTPLCGVGSLALDNEGNLFMGDGNRVRMIDRSTGIITTVAGDGGVIHGMITMPTVSRLQQSLYGSGASRSTMLGICI